MIKRIPCEVVKWYHYSCRIRCIVNQVDETHSCISLIRQVCRQCVPQFATAAV